MVLRALKYSFIAGVGFWFLLGLFVMGGGYTAQELAMDGHKLLPSSISLWVPSTHSLSAWACSQS